MAARSFTGESGEVNFEAICRIYPDFIIILSVEMETVRLCGGEGNTFYVVRELLRKVGLPVRIIQITVKLRHHKKNKSSQAKESVINKLLHSYATGLPLAPVP